MRIYEYILVKYASLFGLFVFIDQLSKCLIRYFGGFYVCNPNISWGIHVPEIFFWFFWVLIIAFLTVALAKRYFIDNTLYVMLILAGAISNMIDRIRFGCVIDFVDFKFWPVFNLADIFIVVGAVFLLVKWKKL